MKCLISFGMSSTKGGTSAQLSGGGELHGGARVTTLVTLRKCTLGNKRVIKILQFVVASTKGFEGGLAWIKPSKKDMAVTFSYSECPHSRSKIFLIEDSLHYHCHKHTQQGVCFPSCE